MAFFLWLTLAVTQAANAGGGDVGLAPALHFDVEAGSAISFLSSIGNANSIASFVVGITLMLMGLDQAVKTASSISSTLGGFAQKARGAGMSLGRLGALAPFLAAGYAGRAGARAVDRRLDITRSASTLGLKTLKALPVPDSVASPVRAGLTRGLTMRREEAQKQAAEQKAVIDRTAKFGTDQEQKLVGATYSTSGSAFRTLGAKAGSMKVSEVLATDKIRDREARKNEDKYVKQLVDSGVSESEAKNGSKVLAEKDAYREQQSFLQNQLNLARGLGDLDKVEDLEKQIRVNPYLAADEKRASEIEKLATDPEKYKDVNKQDALSGDLLTGFMLKHGWQTDANGELKIADTAAYDRLKESVQKSGNKNLLEGLDAHEMFVMNSPGLKTTEANNLQHRKNSADGLMQTFDVSRSQDGKWIENKSGTRLHTKNYQDALGKVTSDRDIRSGASSGPAITQLDRDTNARVFMANGGAFSEFLSKSQASSTDTVPVQTASRIVVSDISTGFDALKNDNTRAANDNLRGAGKILLQIDQQGVSDSQQIPVLASMANGMRDANGAVDASIIRKIDQLIPEIRDSVVKAAEVTKKRADDILRNGVKNAQEQAVVDLADAISKEIANNKKNVNSRILNAYRPGRNQNSNP